MPMLSTGFCAILIKIVAFTHMVDQVQYILQTDPSRVHSVACYNTWIESTWMGNPLDYLFICLFVEAILLIDSHTTGFIFV